MHVCAVDRATVDDIGAVDGLNALFADVAELRRLLEAQRVPRRHRQCTGSGGQFAIAQGATAGLVDDLMQLRTALAQRDFPLVGSRLFQHRTHTRAATPHRFEPVAHAARAIGVLVAVTHFVARRLLDPHMGPIGVQLIGHHQAQTGTHALAHFRTVANHRHGTVGGDADVDLGVIDQPMGHGSAAIFLDGISGKRLGQAPTGGDHQRAGGADALQETTATEVIEDEISG